MAVFAIGKRVKYSPSEYDPPTAGSLYYFKKGKSGKVWRWDAQQDHVDAHIQLAGDETYYNLDAAFLWPAGVGDARYSGLTFLFWSSKDANNYQWTAINDAGGVYYGKWAEKHGKLLRDYMGKAKGETIDNPFFTLPSAADLRMAAPTRRFE